MKVFLGIAFSFMVGGVAGAAAPAKTCEQGNLDRCYADAVALLFGEGVPKDEARALSLLKESCAKGHGASCATAEAVSAPRPTPQTMPAEGMLPPPRRQPRVDIKTSLTEGCEAGDSAKCLDLSRRYERGTSVGFEKDPVRALELLTKACDGTSGEACRMLGKERLKGKPAKAALERGVELDGKACDGGDLRACWRHGYAYLRGEGAKLKPEVGREILDAACVKKDAWSCTTMGDIFHHADGVHRDRKKAYEYYSLGCELGASHGCFGQGLVVEALAHEGKLGEKDLSLAAQAFAQSCEKNYATACWKLAGLFKDGRGVPKDAAKAQQLLELSCTKGIRQACAGKFPERAREVDEWGGPSPRPDY